MMPPAFNARFHHVRGEIVGTLIECSELLGGRDATAMGGEPGTEHVRHETQWRLATDRARDAALGTDVARRADQFRMGVAHLMLAEPAAPELVDQVPSCEAVIDHATTGAPQR